MAKAPKPKRHCIFCGVELLPANTMSGEHLWSEWMVRAKLIPKSAEYVEYKERFTRGPNKPPIRYEKVRKSSVTDKKFRIVCKDCNNKWMSDIERAASPYLTPLISAIPVSLDAAAQKLIVDWIVLKMLVAEHAEYYGHPADPIFDQSARTKIMATRELPPGIRIWISSQAKQKWTSRFHREAIGLGFSRTFPPPKHFATRPKNVQQTTWGIGYLLVYFVATTDMEVYPFLERGGPSPLHGFWPRPPNAWLRWPPEFYAPDDYLDDLTMALRRLSRAPFVIRI